MTNYRLRSGVGFGQFAGCTIVLDVAADRYWRLGAPAGACLEAARDGRDIPPSDLRLNQLVQLGLVVADDVGLSNRRDPLARTGTSSIVADPVSSALDDVQHAELDLYAIAAGLVLPLITRIELRAFPLAWILSRTLRSRGKPSRSVPALAVLARRFDRARRLAPVKPRCLPDSLAFRRYVAHYGYTPRFVFGVTAHPFAAHCWVQDDVCVLTDALDHARQFRAILIL